ncbi:MAG TPA: DNA sulfur modification protein DndB [Pseudobdellovibrionaceae bacterium]|nr:DNA sulfur modification protein DndB [Pseudobdellovibrionaceae bacterium]
MSYNYVFTAIRGKQAGRDYYVVMCPLKLIPKIFLFDEAELRAEIRAQRVLNKARVPEIGEYLAENPRDYVLSSITASIDSEVNFESFEKGQQPGFDAGKLIVPMDARFLINDGQHRRAGIEEALKLRPDLGEETISVVFFIDTGLRRAQQMFADLNRHAVRPTMSIGVLYDHRDPLSRLTREVVEKVVVFGDLVEKEKTTISNRSTKLFTLSGVYQATRVLLGKREDDPVTDKDARLAVEFWDAVASQIPDWGLAKARRVAPAALREDTVHAHGVTLLALGIMGASLLSTDPSNWKTRLKKLVKVDWSRNNQMWEGRALVGGRVSKSQVSVRRTANYLKQTLGIALTAEDQRFESSQPSLASPSRKYNPKGKSSRRPLANA